MTEKISDSGIPVIWGKSPALLAPGGIDGSA
jgi:hypothetical protein